MDNKLYYLLQSRKFWAALAALLIAILGPRAGIDSPEMTSAIITIVAYILGTALEDGLRNRG